MWRFLKVKNLYRSAETEILLENLPALSYDMKLKKNYVKINGLLNALFISSFNLLTAPSSYIPSSEEFYIFPLMISSETFITPVEIYWDLLITSPHPDT